MTTKKNILVVSIIALLFSAPAFGALKIGVIDMQKAVQATSQGKKAKTALEKEFNKKKKELKNKEAQLKKMSEELEKKSLVLSDEVRLKKNEELQREMIKYRETVGKSQIDIQKKERELTLPILKKLREIINKIGDEESYTVILERSENSVMFAAKAIDLTDKVVKKFEKK